MKYRTTIKEIRTNACNPRSAGYCDLYYLLINHSPNAYTCGMYGWNFDIYDDIYGVTICTGYRSMPGKQLENINEYEKKAEAIFHDEELTYDEKREAVENLLHKFCKLNGGY